MIPRLPYGRKRVAIGAVGGVNIGDHLGTGTGDVLPAGMNGLQKGQVTLGVDGGNGAKPVIGRRLYAKAKCRHPRKKRVNACGPFGRGLSSA